MTLIIRTLPLLSFCISCASTSEETPETRTVDPTSVGEYDAISKSVNISSRDGLTLPTQIWYPSQQPSLDLHRYGELKEGGAFASGAVDCSTTRPVVLFSHGNTGMGYQSYFLGEFLASHGYIVVAPNHVGNTIFDNDESRKPELILRRPQDISDAYDWLIEQSEFSDCIDPEGGFAVAGHSFGGYTVHSITGGYLDTDATLEHCAEYGGWLCEHVEEIATVSGAGIYDNTDERIWGAVSMTPAALETLMGGIASISVPTLVLGGEYDTLTPVSPLVQAIYDFVGSERKNFAVLKKAGHYTFSNACDFLNTYEDCGDEFLNTTEAHSLINTMTLAFLEDLQGTPDMNEHLPPSDDRIEWQ